MKIVYSADDDSVTVFFNNNNPAYSRPLNGHTDGWYDEKGNLIYIQLKKASQHADLREVAIIDDLDVWFRRWEMH